MKLIKNFTYFYSIKEKFPRNSSEFFLKKVLQEFSRIFYYGEFWRIFLKMFARISPEFFIPEYSGE